MDNLQSLSYFYPELFLTGLIIISIIYDLFLDRSKSDRVGWVMVAGLIIITIILWFQDHNRITTLFSNAIVLDPFSTFFKILMIFSTILVALISLYSDDLNEYRKGEYFTLLGIVLFGLFLMVSSIDLIMVYLSIEIVSIMSFVLAGYLKQNTKSNEAALKYVVYGAFSSGIMLFGLSYIYGLTGSTNFFEIQKVITNSSSESNSVILLSIIMILAGFGYKVSAVPFHFWTPDVYEGSPTTITAYLSVAPKAGAFAMMVRFFNQIFSDGGALVSSADSVSSSILAWPDIISLLAVITMTLGNVVAIQQNSIKRMLAYSSVAHAGYILLALPVMSSQSIYAIMLYFIMYLFMNLGAFFVLIVVKNKTEGETFDDFKGLGWEMPFIGIVMTLFMISLTGLPPTAGFIAKFYIFAALINGGESFYWLVIIGGINSVISLYYYIRVVKVMYFDGEKSESLIHPSTMMTALLLITAVPTLIFGIYWTPLANWIHSSLVFYLQNI